MGLLKKVASGVLASFPCSRTGSTLCAQNWLRPGWTSFFERPEASDIQRAWGQYAFGNYYYYYSTLFLIAHKENSHGRKVRNF